MFEADLGGKLPELTRYEDYLTSCVFGALKVLPPAAGLLPLLRASTNQRLGISLGEYLGCEGIELADCSGVQYLFWPRSAEYGEPDLVVVLQVQTRSFLLPIEVKFFSGKHGEGEDDQLMRYYLGLSTLEGRRTFGDEAIRRFSGEFLALIYLTQFPAGREIEATLARLALRGLGEAEERIFHLRWQRVYEVIRRLSSVAQDPFRRKVLVDIRKLLEHRGLVPFRGFSRPDPGLTMAALRRRPVFLSVRDPSYR